MPKRSVEETNNESPNSEFKYDDSYNQRRKKNRTWENAFKSQRNNEEIDISEHKV